MHLIILDWFRGGRGNGSTEALFPSFASPPASHHRHGWDRPVFRSLLDLGRVGKFGMSAGGIALCGEGAPGCPLAQRRRRAALAPRHLPLEPEGI